MHRDDNCKTLSSGPDSVNDSYYFYLTSVYFGHKTAYSVKVGSARKDGYIGENNVPADKVISSKIASRVQKKER